LSNNAVANDPPFFAHKIHQTTPTIPYWCYGWSRWSGLRLGNGLLCFINALIAAVAKPNIMLTTLRLFGLYGERFNRPNGLPWLS
jgi:hypothetical protein